MTYLRRYFFGGAIGAWLLILLFACQPARAADTGEFNLQVSPSPLVSTVKPGASTALELKVHNSASASEDLKIEPRAFKIDSKTQQLQLIDDQAPDVASWIHFSASNFTILPGQTYTEKITLAVPKEAGFSYAFALVVSRVNPPPQTSGRAIKASIADFALINVDRPGAVRALELTRFISKQGLYEYLPADFEIEFKNTGNTIVQPTGTVFIQRTANDITPIDTLDVNKGGGYILPGMSRTITLSWDNGFPAHLKKQQPDGTTKDELNWDLGRASQVRFGQYTAKLVAIYDDGHRDVPLESQLTFWVIPWVFLLVALVIILIIGVGVWSVVRKVFNISKRFGHKKMKL